MLLKPDAVQRGLIGRIVGRLEERGLKIVGMKMLRVPRTLAETYYAEHRGKEFFESLMKYITSGPVVAMVLEGADAVARVRKLMGRTNPADAEPGTIRRDFGLTIEQNVIHGSDSPETARREIGLFFASDELHPYARTDEPWIHE